MKQKILIYIPSNVPGNAPVFVNISLGSKTIFLTIPLVELSRPGPNIATFGVFRGQKKRSM